jgi:hypothetical protein
VFGADFSLSGGGQRIVGDASVFLLGATRVVQGMLERFRDQKGTRHSQPD